MEKKNYDEMSLEELREEYQRAKSDEDNKYVRTAWDDDDNEGREVIEVDERKMVILFAIMAIFLIVPLILNIVGVINKIVMTVCFVPAVAIMAYIVLQAKKTC